MRLASVLFLNNSQFNRAAGESSRATSGLTGMITRGLGPLAAFAAGFISLAAAISAFNTASVGAAQFEDFEASFDTLLGSAEAVQERLEFLEDFGAVTPFELPGVVKANKVMETFSKGVLSGVEGMRLLGDAAAFSEQPIEELSVHVGRLYEGLQTGRAVGESLARLQELALISGEARMEIERLQAEAKKGPEVWAVAEQALGKFSGEMDRRSRTWNGMMSNLKDGIDAAFRSFGQPINDALKPSLEEAIDLTVDLEEAAGRFGQRVADAIGMLRAAFESGFLDTLFSQALLLGGSIFINFFSRELAGIAQGLISALQAGFVSILDTFNFGMRAIADSWAASILSSLEDGLRRVPGLSGTADGLRRATERAAQNSTANSELSNFAAQSILPLMEQAFADARGELRGVDLIDLGPLREGLRDTFDYLRSLIPERPTDPTVDRPDPGTTGSEGGVLTGLGSSLANTADRLTRIGGFVGTLGPSTDYARRTADNTSRANALLLQSNRLLSQINRFPSNGGTIGAWA